MYPIRNIITLCSIALSALVFGQCPQLYDGDGIPNTNPYWFSCSGADYTVIIASPQNIGPFTIDWGDGSPTYIGAGLVSPQTVTHNYTATVDTFIVVFTETGTGCVVQGVVVMEESTSASIQIPVGGLTQVCAPDVVEFINSSTNVSENTVFTWDFGDGSPQEVYDHTNLGQTISHTYQQGTVNCETTVTLWAENYCNTLQGGPSVATFNPIRIWDIDDAAISPSATLLCYPDTVVTFLNTTDRNCLAQGNIFQRYEYWNFGDYWGQGQDSIIDWTPWPPTFPQTIAYPGIGVYDVMLLDSNYCGIDTAYVTIEIVPPPSVTLTVSPDTICAGEIAYFDETTTGGANQFLWDFDDGNGVQDLGPGDQQLAYGLPGTYTVQYSASIQGATAGCTDMATVDVVVLPAPQAAFTLSDTAACNSLSVDFTNNSSAISPITHHWDFGDGTTSTQMTPPTHTYNTVGSYTITLTVTNSFGCSHYVSQVVNVYDPPVPVISANNVCEGEVATFSDITIPTPGNPIISWDWDLDDGTTSTDSSFQHAYGTGGTYNVTLLVNTPYCSGSSNMTVSVEPKPVAAFTPDVTSGCSPLTVNFTNGSTGATSYLWTMGDGGSYPSNDVTHTFQNFGTTDTTYHVMLIASTSAGCSDTAYVNITVSPPINAGFVHDATPGCAPLAVNFTNTSNGATSYQWSFGDGTTSTATNPSHTYINNSFFIDVHDVTLVANAPGGCTDTMIQQISVYPTPTFTFVTEPDSGCSPHTVTFPSVVGAVTYQWDFGDGSTGTGPTPQHTYDNGTTNDLNFPVQLIAANAFGCNDTTYSQVTVFPNPVAAFELVDTNGCHQFTSGIVNLSTGADSYLWNYGDGSTSDTSVAVHPHTWNNFVSGSSQSYTLSLTATTDNGCTDQDTLVIEVYPQVIAGFVSDTAGCSPFDPGFTNISIGADSYKWIFGDGDSSAVADPTHAYVNTGVADANYSPMLIASNVFGCNDTATADVTVYPAPITQFTASSSTGCHPLTVDFQDISVGAAQQDWSFGDGATNSGGPGDVQHTFLNLTTAPVTYNVVLVSTSLNGCTDTMQQPITVYPPVTAAMSVDTSGCSPLTLDFMNASIGDSTVLWNMGDGTVLIDQDPTHTFTNNTPSDVIYTVTLTATSAYGCIDSVQQQIVVHPTPFAAFQATPFTQQFPNSTVQVANNSSPGNWNYQWDFGDGQFSADMDPGSHTYGSWGDYTIQLVVFSDHCSDTISQVIDITPPLPTADFIGSGEGCVPLTVAFTNTSLLGQSYQWNFGDGGTSAADNPVYTYNVPGTYTVSLTAYGVGGGVSTVVKIDSVIVHPRATAYFTHQPNEVVVPSDPVFFYNLSGGATSYQWDFGDGTTSTDENPVHNYAQAGEFDVTLIASNEYNCPDTFRLPAAVLGISAGDLVFPNAFTPTNTGPTDGSYDPNSYANDHFFPLYEGVEEYLLQIYNRWGELVFESEDVRRGWDGYYRGQPAKQDVYVWKATARFSDGRETLQSGDVTLLR